MYEIRFPRGKPLKHRTVRGLMTRNRMRYHRLSVHEALSSRG
jgi:hypothetical protein